jgi:hypothetical protein
MLWVHQVKIYIKHLSSKSKRTTKKSYEEDECVEFLNMNQASDQTLTLLTFDNHILHILCLFEQFKWLWVCQVKV